MDIHEQRIPNPEEPLRGPECADSAHGLIDASRFAFDETLRQGSVSSPIVFDRRNPESVQQLQRLLAQPARRLTVLHIEGCQPVTAVFDAETRQIGLLNPLTDNVQSFPGSLDTSFVYQAKTLGADGVTINPLGYSVGDEGTLAETPPPPLAEMHRQLAETLDGGSIILLEDEDAYAEKHRECLERILAAHGKTCARFSRHAVLEDALKDIETANYTLAIADTNVFERAEDVPRRRTKACGTTFMEACRQRGIPVVASGASALPGMANTAKYLAYDLPVDLQKFLQVLGRPAPLGRDVPEEPSS